MNSIQFATKLNELIGEAVQGVDRKEIEPSNIVGSLFIAATQLSNMFTQIAMARQVQEKPRIFVPGPMQKGPPPSLRTAFNPSLPVLTHKSSAQAAS